MRHRRTEQRDDRVADELLDGAPMPLELVPRAPVIPVEQRADVFGVATVGPAGEAHEIGEENRDDLALLPFFLDRQRRAAGEAEVRDLGVVLPAAAANRHRPSLTARPTSDPWAIHSELQVVTAAATQLSVSRASLVAAIQSSANTTIDAAVDDDDLSATDAADLKDEVVDNLNEAYSLSRASIVASKLNITSAALNTGFRNARKALLTAQIDAAVTAGTLTSDDPTTLKAQVAALTAGYESGSLLGAGGHGGDPGGGFGDGPGRHGH